MNDSNLSKDVACASAAYLCSLLPELVKLPASEQFERLTAHFEAAITAYRDGLNGWDAEPSTN